MLVMIYLDTDKKQCTLLTDSNPNVEDPLNTVLDAILDIKNQKNRSK